MERRRRALRFVELARRALRRFDEATIEYGLLEKVESMLLDGCKHQQHKRSERSGSGR